MMMWSGNTCEFISESNAIGCSRHLTIIEASTTLRYIEALYIDKMRSSLMIFETRFSFEF